MAGSKDSKASKKTGKRKMVEDDASKAEAADSKKTRTVAPSYKVDGQGRVAVRVLCSQKKLLAKLLMDEFAKSIKVEFLDKYKMGFIKFATEADLKKAIARGEVKIQGVPVQVKVKTSQKGDSKRPEGVVVGPLMQLMMTVLQKELQIEALPVANLATGLVAQVPLKQAEKAFARGSVQICGQTVDVTYHVRNEKAEKAK